MDNWRVKHGKFVRKRMKQGKTGAIAMWFIKLSEKWGWIKSNLWKIVEVEKLGIHELFRRELNNITEEGG